MTQKNIRSWHVLNKDLRLEYPDNREVKEGKTLYVLDKNKKIELCGYGMHSCMNPLDCFYYKYSPIFEFVLSIDVQAEEKNKVVGKGRHTYFIIDSTPILPKFARWCTYRAKKHAADATANTYTAVNAEKKLQGKKLEKLLFALNKRNKRRTR